MAKAKDGSSVRSGVGSDGVQTLVKVDEKIFDPTLESLFASSSGPVEAPSTSRYRLRIQKQRADSPSSEANQDSGNRSPSSGSESDGPDDINDSAQEEAESLRSDTEQDKIVEFVVANGEQESGCKKRKRADKEEIEDIYMRKLAREEQKEEEERQKKRKGENGGRSVGKRDDCQNSEDAEAYTIPQHESLATTSDHDASELEKAARTVFLSNVSTECINSKSDEKALKKHLESFCADLADNQPPHKIESIRFRSIAFSNSLPKRAAFAKKETMDTTTRSTNAYAVYTTKVAAREAVKRLNGSILLKRHLHVDSVAHPRKIDHRRCVFVGNLPFVDDESQTPNEDGSQKKPKTPADVEEGLWVQFSKVGTVESVRVVRDARTRVGKGFAYVQFVDENSVEAALQHDEKKFPPMLPRILRVTRCKAEKKKKIVKPRGPPPSRSPNTNRNVGYTPKLTGEQKSMQGRARSMLGKAAKAQTRDSIVFEGHRATEGQGKSGLKFKGSGGKKKGVNGRKSRSASWKQNKGKK